MNVFYLSSLICLLLATPHAHSFSQLITDGFVSTNVAKSPSNAIDNRRLITVYLPDGYDVDLAQRYPVVYYLPGYGGTHTTTANGNSDRLDELIENQFIVPMIVVHVDGSALRFLGGWYVDSTIDASDKRDFEQYIIKELIPYIDATYRTKAQAAFRGVMGHSMGGYGALYLGIKYPDIFTGFGAASPTPLWTLATDAASPGDSCFSMQRLLVDTISGISSVNASGKIVPPFVLWNDQTPPTPGKFEAGLVYSLSAALSANTAKLPYLVDLPFNADADGTVIFQPSPPAAESKLECIQSVFDRWRTKDPILSIAAYRAFLKKQAIYLDGGNLEPANNVGSRVFSDALINNNIEHEYILFTGNHETCLTNPSCSRQATMFEMFSAKFAAAGVYADDARVKLVGTGSIVLKGNAKLNIPRGTFLGVETSPTLNISTTKINFAIKHKGNLSIGTPTELGGALQIGNHFSKAELANNPALNGHTIACKIIIDGPQAQCRIGMGGFLGLGVGIDGQEPQTPNYWGLNTLTNLTNMLIDVRCGSFTHNIIASGAQPGASLLALGPDACYSFQINDGCACLQGGGNIISAQPGYLFHPIVLTSAGDFPPRSDFYYIRNRARSGAENDVFYNQPMQSRTTYTHKHAGSLLLSSGNLRQQPPCAPFPFFLTPSPQQKMFDYLSVRPVDPALAVNVAVLGIFDGEPYFAFVGDKPLFEPPIGEPTLLPIYRFRVADFPLDAGVDLTQLMKKGAIGVRLQLNDDGTFTPLSLTSVPTPVHVNCTLCTSCQR